MAYKYDVFLSYPHGLAEQWVVNYFLTLFKWHLEGSLGRSPEIFIDREGIASGDSWPLRLKKAISLSRSLVAIWTPSYFRSKWCMHEINLMLRRETDEGFRTPENPDGLILPVCISDGQTFPEFAKNIQYSDFRDFMLIGPAFEQSIIYIEFQKKIRGWSEDVADAIEHAPAWKASWLDYPLVPIPEVSAPTFEPPILE
ncbi:toll/interleukin-1 receptor domain-containing protein [candidate division KSB1 bacterium]|nr:toll/interleukin-1 receptor domain-containing protein [candidate division KSB1 bacterium]